MTEQPDRRPEVRASDVERNEIATLLNQAVGEGRISLDEFTERVGLVYEATTRRELDQLVADLPVARDVATPDASQGVVVRSDDAGDADRRKWDLAIMGGSDLKGRWRVRRKMGFFGFMGGSDINLCDAELDAPEVELVLIGIMGGHTVIVPRGVRVEHVGGFNLMGGDDVKIDQDEVLPNAPVVRIRTYNFMGGQEIKNPKRKKRKRRRALED
ncbi:DUF1707 SHOCT-like domain-containing protein [Actinoalloteichus hymeniacidonis]|uniref:DUF1707 family protein n=1 Tax=Actinoalloteichus hymeniacidonis TaxID=340345 RepID=A0AAC9HPX4_9PSEU|nr:DUF1707 domain-containing protein [Actinoalloteichus hymeniacidonis]AOS63250.1 putative DUF1707 family protein [Actinoalloteichus hymeniacidonis]MBB5908711.1 hypothetical protein [Actinoalloteichus hymeniacidonis]